MISLGPCRAKLGKEICSRTPRCCETCKQVQWYNFKQNRRLFSFRFQSPPNRSQVEAREKDDLAVYADGGAAMERRGGTWQTTTEVPRQSTAGLNCSCARTGVQIEPGTARCRAHVPTPRQAPLPQFPVLVLPPVSHLNHARLQQSGFVGVTLESNFVANRSLATGSFFSSFPISSPILSAIPHEATHLRKKRNKAIQSLHPSPLRVSWQSCLTTQLRNFGTRSSNFGA
jgi:hypothetical protein